MVAVKKPNCKLKICINPKDINTAINRPRYPMPILDDILPRIADAKVFTVFDANGGFWHIKLGEFNSFLTTFGTPFGSCRWLRLPFGISSAPEEFQRRQHEVYEGLDITDVIINDIIIYGCGEAI